MAELRRISPKANRSVSDEVYRVLREAIIRGDLRPNEHLVEMQLAQTLGVSRTPVREAIHRLETDGLARSLPNRSTVAAWHSAEDIQHIYSMRARVEGYAARLTAERATEASIARVESLARKFAQASPREQDSLNQQFHKAIVQACRAERVVKVAMSLVEHSLMGRLYLLHTPGDRERSVREHEAIAAALRDRNGVDAERLVRDHLEWARDILMSRDA
ncbi:MAG TPA: GntR family transcriptional regulator [Chloroflexota bacterium]